MDRPEIERPTVPSCGLWGKAWSAAKLKVSVSLCTGGCGSKNDTQHNKVITGGVFRRYSVVGVCRTPFRRFG